MFAYLKYIETLDDCRAHSWYSNVMNESSFQTPETVADAKAHVAQRTEGMTPTPEEHQGQFTPPDDFTRYCFELQGRLEKTGQIDYHEYARQMWAHLLPGDIEGQELFEQHLITGLHGIDMQKLVFPEVIEHMPELIEKFHEKIKAIAIWSTGDVEGTGYQLAKIISSGVIDEFVQNTRAILERDAHVEFVRNQTALLIADNKFERLERYVINQQLENGGAPIKLVIIEDSRGNFKKVSDRLRTQIESGMITVVPIWFTGSREGINAEKAVTKLEATDPEAARQARETLNAEKANYNAFSSYHELLDDPRYESLLEGGHLLVDFDGVIGDNVAMRVEQASTIYNALASSAATSANLSETELQERISTSISAVPQVSSDKL